VAQRTNDHHATINGDSVGCNGKVFEAGEQRLGVRAHLKFTSLKRGRFLHKIVVDQLQSTPLNCKKVTMPLFKPVLKHLSLVGRHENPFF